MIYSVKEMFYTLQGEGAQTGRPAVFCRFSGCNLWTGRERDRSRAICQFCDTDFVGTNGMTGGRFKDPHYLAQTLNVLWTAQTTMSGNKYVVFTGGEPLLQLDVRLIEAMHDLDFTVAIETNGTIDIPKGVDWICVSPKHGAILKVKQGNELKLVIPQYAQWAESLPSYAMLDFEHFYLQAMDGSHLSDHLHLAIETCQNHPQWKLSVQTHKYLGIF